ncbi:MAG: flagellar biosynthesis protein FlhA [Planctomycetota bacterium]|nr:flagellar biosynthesis protein FlhA [Planctomycetota bacterium]
MASSAAPTKGGRVPLALIRDLVLPLGIIASVLVILVPLPAALIDLLLVVSITLSVVILLTSTYVRTPLEFSVFPSLLLAATLGRLVLNVATTRLILTQAGAEGQRASGSVIQTFGDFVTGGNIVVGLIIFAIIVLIQFVVITRGASRVSEVAARFALDGMPGGQMAIDADLGAGAINAEQAQQRRAQLQQQADFLAAMDGASKFVRGDAVAGIVITLINIVGGMVIGVVQLGMGPAQASDVFTRLTIGDGLASQIPALLISLSAALLVTRNNQHMNLPKELLGQVFSNSQAMFVAAGFLGLLVLTDLPRIPLLIVASACLGLACLLQKNNASRESEQAARENAKVKPVADEQVEQLLQVDPLEIEIGLQLVRLADRQRGGDLLQQIHKVRHSIARQLGIVMPKVRVRDNIGNQPNQYRIKIAGMAVAEGQASTSQELAGHLASCVRLQADEVLTRDATKYLIERLRQTHPVVVDELIPGQLSLGQVQQVLQILLREQVPIRQLALIVEALGDYAARIKDTALLAEYVRQRLARTICDQYRDQHQVLHVITLDPAIEDQVRASMDETDYGFTLRLAPQAIDDLCLRITTASDQHVGYAGHLALLVNPHIRAAVRQMTAGSIPQLPVLSFNEITNDTQIDCVATVRENTGERALAAA